MDQANELTEAVIAAVVHGFYGRVRTDEMLGPVFETAIGPDWSAHLSKLVDFWSSVLLRTDRYDGRPMRAHLQLPGVTPAHFERWLLLFRGTANELCQPELAALFIRRAEMIAESFQLGMFFRPETAVRT